MLISLLLLFGIYLPISPEMAPASGWIAQDEIEISAFEDSILVAADLLQNSPDVQVRRKASTRIMALLTQALNLQGSWDYPFDRVPQISVLLPDDKTYRLFTWQLYLDPDHYQHLGIMQLKKEPNRPIRLLDRSGEYVRLESTIGSADHWLGAVYYKIHTCEYKRKRYWLLFGFDGLESTSKRKIIDVLQLDDDNQPIFGDPVFQYQNGEGTVVNEKHRIVLDYATGSHVRLNYDDHYKMILFDHLMPFADERNGLGLVNIPDGTYEGFKYEKGVWVHVDKVFDKVMDEAPVDFPVLNDRKGKNIFGK